MQLQVEYVDISTIKPYKGNAKEHPKEQIEQIKKSMQEFGNIGPIGIWHNEIVEGHGRYMALKELGEKTIPIIRLDDLTDEQRRAYTLVHNQLTMNSGFNLDTLKVELDNIGEIDMSEFGFNLDGIGEPDEPATPSEPDFHYKEQYAVVVTCKNEQEQEQTYNKLTEMGYECKVVAV